ncbi:MAG: hypothetical protein KDC80_08325 [Saprospiraceae bacterium]|nr:hypothetical protein [Saprospiraceae bacterium]
MNSLKALTVLWFFISGMGAAIAQKPHTSIIKEIKLENTEVFVLQDGVRFNVETGYPKTIYNANYQVGVSGTPEMISQLYLESNLDNLGLKTADLDNLNLYATRKSQAGTTIRFHQYWKGIRVLQGEMAITVSPKNIVTFVDNSYRYHINVQDVTPSVTGSQAREIVLAYLGVTTYEGHTEPELVIFQYKKQADIYYRINLNLTQPLGDWEALVNARTGKILKLTDRACYSHHHQRYSGPSEDPPGQLIMPPVDGNGFVFDPDPLALIKATYGDMGFTDGSDTTTTQLDAQRVPVVLKDITFDGMSTYSLVGPYAEVVDTENPKKGLFTQSTATFNFDRSNDAFEAVNTYYHIDASMRYLNVTLGLNIMPYQYSGGVRFDPHGLGGADNSHYLIGSGELAFGEGGVDDAEDSDVIHHELGHALHDWVTSGGLSQVDGLSEGSGDYWAASYNRSLGHWESTDEPYHWVFNWDGHNVFWNGRVVDYGNTYPSGLVGQIHTDGQIWATAMMKVWDAIGKAKADMAFWNGLGMTSGTSSQNDAANAVYHAAVAMGYGYSDLASIHAIFTSTGYTLPVLPPPVSNDECADAIDISVNTDFTCTMSVHGTLENSTASGVDGASCSGEEDDDVWFSFTATTDIHYLGISNIVGESTPLHWSVWTGDCGNLSLYACLDNALSVALSTTLGTKYYLRLYSEGMDAQQTEFDICISTFSEAPEPCLENDMILTGEFLPGGTYHAINSLTNASTIHIPSNVTANLYAGDHIQLNPDFTVFKGAVLTLDIMPCSGVGSPILYRLRGDLVKLIKEQRFVNLDRIKEVTKP